MAKKQHDPKVLAYINEGLQIQGDKGASYEVVGGQINVYDKNGDFIGSFDDSTGDSDMSKAVVYNGELYAPTGKDGTFNDLGAYDPNRGAFLGLLGYKPQSVNDTQFDALPNNHYWSLSKQQQVAGQPPPDHTGGGGGTGGGTGDGGDHGHGGGTGGGTGNGYTPNPDPGFQQALQIMQQYIPQDQLSQVMQYYGGLGSPDGSGVMGGQSAPGTGQQGWPQPQGPTTNPGGSTGGGGLTLPPDQKGGLPTTPPPPVDQKGPQPTGTPPPPAMPPPRTPPATPPPPAGTPPPLPTGPPGGHATAQAAVTPTGQLPPASGSTVGIEGTGSAPQLAHSAGPGAGIEGTGSAPQLGTSSPPPTPSITPNAAGGSGAATTPTASASSGGTGSGTGTAGSANGQVDQNANAMLQSLLQSWGLGTLASVALKYLQQGYDATTIQYLLTQTPEYQKRFAGNAQRIKNGLPALSPGEYIATEEAYNQVLRSSGLPSGFYDSPDDFTSFIANDVSPSELQARAGDAIKFAQSTDPTYRDALQSYYGIDQSHIAAYFLDPTRAQPLLDKQANAASIGAAALDQGLALTNLNDAFRYTDQGVTESQARQGYSTIAGFLPTEEAIGSRFGDAYTQTDAEQEVLGGLASAQRKRQNLNQKEEALFSGSGGVGSDFYHPDYGLAQGQSGAF